MRITAQQVQEKADALGVTIEATRKNGKAAWKIISNDKELVVQSHVATIEVLDFLEPVPAATVVEPAAPNYALYATPIQMRSDVFENPKATTEMIMSVCDDPTITVKGVIAKIHSKGKSISTSTVSAMLSDVKKTLAYLQKTNRLLVS